MKKRNKQFKLEEYLQQKSEEFTFLFILRFLLFLVLFLLCVYFIFSYFPIEEFAQKCMPIFPILGNILQFLCSSLGKTILIIDGILGYFLYVLIKLKHIN
jgi:hypothetical protein